MKHFKRIIATLLVFALFIGSSIGSFYLFSKGTHDFDVANLSIFDENDSSYYLQKADSHIIFRIDATSEEDAGYALLDSSGNPVYTKIERVSLNSFNILPPEDGYLPGERYTLKLSQNTQFHDFNLANARELVFCIEREMIEAYTFSEDVVEINESINAISDDVIDISNLSVNIGDIIFGQDESNNPVIYKIDDITAGKTATVSTPALDEIYSDLEVYGEYDWDINDIISNPDIEMEIVENVKKSNFFNSLILNAYAAESTPKDGSINVTFKPDSENNSIEIKIIITLTPGKNGLFGIYSLKNQQVGITLSTNLALKTKCNIQGIVDWDYSASLTTGFSWEVDIAPYAAEWKKDKDLEKLFSGNNALANLVDYHKNIRAITEKLITITEDETSGEIKLFDWVLPIPSIPGLYFSTEIKLFAKFEMAADIVIGQSSKTIYTVGVCFTNNEFSPYSNTYSSNDDITLSLRGKAKVKAGIKLVIKATLINDKVANINLDPQVGLYAELYVTIPISCFDEINDSNFIYSYFEPGVYFSANINASVNLLIGKYEFSYKLVEKKFPFEALTLGNSKIAIGIKTNSTTVQAINNAVSIPDVMFEYFDVKTGIKGIETLKQSKIKFVTSEGDNLKVENGKIILSEASATNGSYITATYQHSDGKTYSTIFKVLISGSILEGKVSAYANDLSTGEISGATVKLFSNPNDSVPITVTQTDESGKFSFNVSPGEYTLMIGASGYRTLLSTQRVRDNEIKYTEHILLIDNEQVGNGSAGGTVTNALNGRGLSNVTIKLRADWNNTTGGYYAYETTTSSAGKYNIQNIPVGYYTVEASLNGYVTGYSNIIVLNQDAKSDYDFTITPVLNGNEIRIVLTWGETPRDLDSHLIGKTPSNDSFNVYYSNKVYRYDSVEMANLDVDDTSSYGPETITILQDIYGTYIYAVHDYSNGGSNNSDKLSYSGATVRVFMGSNQVAEYHVPTGQVGTYWTVFQMDRAGNIVPINSISNTKPTAVEGGDN